MVKQRTEHRKELMIKALTKSLGNITIACKAVGVERCTHYEWLKKDPEYKRLADELPDIEIDFYESALRKLIHEGSPAATIFALKAKGKKRGWIEKQEISHVGDLDSNVSIHINLQKESKEEDKIAKKD